MSHAASQTVRLLVDMTPLEPNGSNGGAGLVAATLVRNLAALTPDLNITLLTAQASHHELAVLDAPNVRRECVIASRTSRSAARSLVDRLLPLQARDRLKRGYRWLSSSKQDGRIADQFRPDVLLCPFTVPHFWQAGVPCLSIVYDLQYLTYPAFFSPEQRLNRHRHIEDACKRSDRVVCISDYVRSTLLANVQVCAERVVTIPLGLLQEFDRADASALNRHGLRSGEFLLYPSNFWPHKNHPRLFEAVRMHRRAHPESALKLVCTGAPNALMRELELLAESLLPGGVVVFANYVRDDELAALFEACAAVVYPSLYEGFGMPVLEAMAHGKPVLCSNVTSLPEVAGDAAIYFDPTDPHQIASAIRTLNDTVTTADLVRRGRERAAGFGTGRDMAVRYLALVRQLTGSGRP